MGCASPPVAPAVSCVGCHGSGASSAPPNALGGLEATSFRGVGAHTLHLQGGSRLSKPLACEECHLVPATVGAAGHIDDAWPAEVVWGPLASANGAEGVWNGTDLTCSGSYCHGGAFPRAEPRPAPVWNVISTGGQERCTYCHDHAPPTPPHTNLPPSPDCAACHPSSGAIVDPATHLNGEKDGCDGCHAYPPASPGHAGLVDPDCADCHPPNAADGFPPDTHRNGVVDFGGGPLACDTCHGANGDPAPPPDLGGDTDTTSPGVGAHSAHLQGGSLGGPIACATCHPVPATVNEGTHQDGTVDVVFGGIAGNGGVTPTWDAGTATCTVYCHGASLQGTPPVWTTVDGTQATCGTCHTLPPPAPHPGSANCAGCHPTAGAGPVIVDPLGHIDGAVDF